MCCCPFGCKVKVGRFLFKRQWITGNSHSGGAGNTFFPTRNRESHVHIHKSVMQRFLCISYGSSLLTDYSEPAAVGLQQHRIVRDYTLAVRLAVWGICSQLRTALHKLRAIMKLFNVGAFIPSRCSHRVSALYFTVDISHKTWRGHKIHKRALIFQYNWYIKGPVWQSGFTSVK